MKTLIIVFITFSFILCFSELESSVFEGEDYEYPLEGTEIGVKRRLYDEGGEWQFYYFCEKSKGENKKKCGNWVDKKGAKIKGATNKVTLEKDKAIILKITVKDRGGYTSIFEDPKKESGLFRLSVGTRPPPPPLYA